MYIKKYYNSQEFEGWSGAQYHIKKLKEWGYWEYVWNELEGICEMENEVPTETEINDFFWFEEDTIAEWCDFRDWEDMERRCKEENDQQ